MVKQEKIQLNLSILNALIYPKKIRHDTIFMRITLQCNDCKKAKNESGKYNLTIKENIIEDLGKNANCNQVAIVNVEYFTHGHLIQISSSQKSNEYSFNPSDACSSTSDAFLSTNNSCSSKSPKSRSNYVSNIEFEKPMNIVRLTKEIYRNELRGEEREKVFTRYLI